MTQSFQYLAERSVFPIGPPEKDQTIRQSIRHVVDQAKSLPPKQHKGQADGTRG